MSTATLDLRLPEEVDGVFVGGGHNALVAAAYLARAGLSVLVLEAGATLGGGVRTDQATLPLFRHNLHAFFVRWTPDYRIWHDLELDRFGVRALYPEVQNGIPYAHGERALLNYRDVDRSIAAIREVSSADADAYARAHAESDELTVRILAPLRFAPPLPGDEEAELLGRSRLGKRLLALTRSSALDLVREWLEWEPLRALVGFNVAVRGYLPVIDQPGTGYVVPLALANSHQGRLIEGGSAEMTRALAAAVYAAGGLAATRAPVAAIDVQGGRARGVTLRDGRQVRARRFVASSVPAPITLPELVGRSHLDPALVTALEGYRWLEEGLFGVHLALRERPRFTAEATAPDLPRAFNLALGYESSDDLVRDMRALQGRELPPRAALHASVPTLHDPSQAPDGFHTTFGWQFVPRSSDWGEQADRRQLEDMLGTYARYAPNVQDVTLGVTTHSPADTGRLVPSMPRGDRHHGSYHPDNWAANRPHQELSGYRTPVDGLYLCGSSQHPGGSFTGSPGFNAAGVIADDLGVAAWWQRPDAREVLAALD
jgi:phytoene dehydrogenase-like protein